MRGPVGQLWAQGKATKKSNTSEIARLNQAWSIASWCKSVYNKASMQATILVQDIETGDSWEWARQDSGPLGVGGPPRAREAAFFFRRVPTDVTAASWSFVGTGALGSGSCPGNSEVL